MPKDTMMLKQFVSSDIKIDDDERTITAVISTGSIDRDKEVVKATGGNFDSYLKNPVVLWAHDYKEMPIAKTVWLKQGTKKITAKARFAETEMAEEVYQLYKGGFLKAFSIGFIPKKRHSPTPDDIKKNPDLVDAWNIIDEWELLEFSAVPIPANPEALMQAVKTKAVAIDEVSKELDLEITDDEQGTEVYSLADVVALAETYEEPIVEVKEEIIEVSDEVPIEKVIMSVTPIKEVSVKAETLEILKKQKGIVY